MMKNSNDAKNYSVKTYDMFSGKECQSVVAPIIGYDPKFHLPILDIPMMSDEKWNELTEKKVVMV